MTEPTSSVVMTRVLIVDYRPRLAILESRRALLIQRQADVKAQMIRIVKQWGWRTRRLHFEAALLEGGSLLQGIEIEVSEVLDLINSTWELQKQNAVS